jgi:hypothetical protein
VTPAPVRFFHEARVVPRQAETSRLVHQRTA